MTSVDYDDGYGADGAWTYDDAGNRSGAGYSYDNLNRMSASPGYAYSNDILGNRTWRNYNSPGVQRYIWDDVNRLKSACGVSSGASYKYRADGMRVQKISGLSIEWIEPEEASPYYDENQDQDFPTVRYYYDGQMGIEEDHTYIDNETNVKDVTRYGIGARGIDWMSFSANGAGAVVSFPIYDGHGNMLYTLKRESGNNFSLNNRKVYDVWGSLRSGSGGAEQEHCANLGHRTDNESGLVYMRARYYEPWTGRFISEDPARDGLNWFGYAKNNPVSNIDPNGQVSFVDLPELLRTILEIIANVNDLASASGQGYGLFKLIPAVVLAKNAQAVEEAWSEFMDYWSFSALDSVDSSGNLDFAVSSASIVLGYLVPGGNILSGAAIALKMDVLIIGYSFRIAWYLGDINNF